jgi:hypothetical protein
MLAVITPLCFMLPYETLIRFLKTLLLHLSSVASVVPSRSNGSHRYVLFISKFAILISMHLHEHIEQDMLIKTIKPATLQLLFLAHKRKYKVNLGDKLLDWM